MLLSTIKNEIDACSINILYSAACNFLTGLIYEDSANIYADVSYEKSTAASIHSYGDDHNQNSVWSYEYEQYVNPANFKQAEIASVGGINQYMGSNPTVAGQSSGNVFFYNETAGEYHLQ